MATVQIGVRFGGAELDQGDPLANREFVSDSFGRLSKNFLREISGDRDVHHEVAILEQTHRRTFHIFGKRGNSVYGVFDILQDAVRHRVELELHAD